MARAAFGLSFVLLALVSACQSKGRPPVVEATVLDVRPAPDPTPSGPPTASQPLAHAPTESVEASSAAALAERFAATLNDGDSGTTEQLSTVECWRKECASISSQAKRKFKVKRAGELDLRGVRGVADFDILCEGTRLCDKVMVLVARDCAHPSRWLVHDVTENKKKRASWIDEAPPACR